MPTACLKCHISGISGHRVERRTKPCATTCAASRDPRNEPGQPAVRRAAHPRRVAEDRVRGRSVDSRQVHPTAEWIAHQITAAFPWNEAPDYLIRDRDGSYGDAVTRRLAAMGIRDHPTA